MKIINDPQTEMVIIKFFLKDPALTNTSIDPSKEIIRYSF